MSLKTRILLSHGGRDQFGDPGEPYFAPPSPGLSRSEIAAVHAANARFSEEFGGEWERFICSRSGFEVWQQLFRHGKPAFSTFEKQRRAFVSAQEHYRYVIVLYKYNCLMAIGYTLAESQKIMSRYKITRRYLVEPREGRRKSGRSPGWVARLE